MDKLKEQRYRGLVIAGIGGIVGFIFFFVPYLTYSSVSGVSNPISLSFSGEQIGGWLWLEFIATLVAIAIPIALIYRSNPFGLSNVPLEKQIRYGIFAIIGAGAIAVLVNFIFALNQNSIVVYWYGAPISYVPGSNTVNLSVGFWFFMIAALAILGGGIYALRMIGSLISQPWGYPSQSTQYPPYVQPYQTADQPPYGQPPYQAGNQPQYPPYPTQYPQADQQQYQPTELKQPYQPTGQQYQPTEFQQPPYQQQQYPPQQYPPQQYPPSQ